MLPYRKANQENLVSSLVERWWTCRNKNYHDSVNPYKLSSRCVLEFLKCGLYSETILPFW